MHGRLAITVDVVGRCGVAFRDRNGANGNVPSLAARPRHGLARPFEHEHIIDSFATSLQHAIEPLRIVAKLEEVYSDASDPQHGHNKYHGIDMVLTEK